MKSKLENHLLQICNSLKNHSVQYMIIGGTAVALHGYFRRSSNMSGQVSEKPDIDFWYNPTYDNYFRLLEALQELGQDVSTFKEEKTPNPKKSFFRYEYPNFTLDFLPTILNDEKFRDSFKRCEVAIIKGIEIYFLGYQDLIANKLKTARAKDLIDIERLKQIKKGKPGK